MEVYQKQQVLSICAYAVTTQEKTLTTLAACAIIPKYLVNLELP
jgi:hypothetical protein